MILLRVRWSAEARAKKGADDDGSEWFLATVENSRQLIAMRDAGCEVYGEGSHWLEQWEPSDEPK